MRTLHAVLCGCGLGSLAEAGDPWDRVPPPAESLFEAEIPLHDKKANALRFGGHARSMGESYRNRDFGFAPIDNDAWVHHRVQAFATWEHEEGFALRGELTWGDNQGMRNALAPPDQDQIDLLQLHAQVTVDQGDSSLVLRGGRQILFYGSGRLLAHREGANKRLVHDALRISWRREGWSLDALVASPVRVGPDAFDNDSSFDEALLWGLYASGPSPFGARHGIDFYYLGLRRDSSPLARDSDDLRHTIGTRWFGEAGPWTYNHEFILQGGELADRDILAGAISLGAGYTFDAPLNPTLGFRGDLISGGQSATRVNTFDPLFQANNYFNEGGFVSPSNLYNLNPRVELQLSRTVSLNLGVNFLWRFDSDDAVYGPPFRTLAGPAPDGQRHLGTAYPDFPVKTSGILTIAWFWRFL